MKFLAWQQVYRNHSDGGGSGASNTSAEDGKNTNATGGAGTGGNTSANNNGGGAGNGSSNGNQENEGNGTSNTGTQADDKKFTQAEVDRIISERLSREKEKQDREQREKQGEFEKLYNEFKPKFEQVNEENTKLSERLKRLEEANHKQIEDQIKDWPEEVKALDPGNSDLEVRLAWVERVKPLAQKLVTPAKAPNLEGGGKGNESNSTGNFVQNYMGRRYGVEQKKA